MYIYKYTYTHTNCHVNQALPGIRGRPPQAGKSIGPAARLLIALRTLLLLYMYVCICNLMFHFHVFHFD